ncbi:MAG: glycosyltransferase [Ruminococcus sp.]|nr:glycosyltransferase [Ruminococcus sp.]
MSILNLNNLKKTVRYLKKNGIGHTFYAARERMEEERRADYLYREPKEDVLAAQREKSRQYSYRFSIVVPAYETKAEFLREMIDSVRRQSYENWELVIADAGKSRHVEEIVETYRKMEGESRIRYIRLPENKGISENTNAAVAQTHGDYIGLLDHDDLLTPDALYEMAALIKEAGENGQAPVMLYSDEDKYENNGCYEHPNRKYKFNLDLILSNNYICHFMILKADVLKELKLRGRFDGAQDYDLVLRTVARLLGEIPAWKLPERILHVPKVLYHWRCHEDSTAANTASKSYAYEAGKAALEEFCKTQGWQVEVTHSLHLGFYQITYRPDIFTLRPEVGIIGGRILNNKNKITAGIYDENGVCLYQGLHREYSGGATHKAALMQDGAAVDIRCMRVCAKLQPVFAEITGVPYREQGKWKLADISAINCDEEGYRKLSMTLGRAARAMGYLVVWDPQITIKGEI